MRMWGGVWSDELVEEDQTLLPGLGCGRVHGGGGEVRKGVLRCNPWVGGGDGKIISPVGSGDLPSGGWSGPPFQQRQILEGRRRHILGVG